MEISISALLIVFFGLFFFLLSPSLFPFYLPLAKTGRTWDSFLIMSKLTDRWYRIHVVFL